MLIEYLTGFSPMVALAQITTLIGVGALLVLLVELYQWIKKKITQDET
ncbi:hypothetical protein [Paenibacillus sp. 481]|nr:hypothetical protein [Paenibacillus sp. 481]UHA74567.1 hypothetical protein KIK04_05580 [Paenibacillus sp. 481]